MIIGNMVITRGKGVVEITLNTFNKGMPHAVFTDREIPEVIAAFRAVQPVRKAPAVIEDDESWRDLI